MKEQNENLLHLMDICKKLLFCADKGDMLREDASCGVLYGIVRDCAYKMLNEADKEKKSHIDRGIWDCEKDDFFSV